MEVLNLATSDKQDEILANFPISCGTDFLEMMSISQQFAGSGTSERSVLDIEGNGVLAIVNIWYAGTSTKSCKIIIDGVEDSFTGDSGSSTFLLYMKEFKQSLQIRLGSSSSNVAVSYFLK